MENITKKELNILIQFVWDSIEDAERIVNCQKALGIASKEWVLKSIEEQKTLLEKLIEFDKTFKNRKQ